MVVLALAISIFNPKVAVESVSKDTLYYVVFFDLFEKDFDYGTTQKDFKALVNERKDLVRQIRNRFSRQFILLPADSCFKEPVVDFERGVDTVGVQKYCDRCHATKKLLIVNASWTYLSEPSFKELERKHRSADLLMSYTYIIGTWFDIRVHIYDPIQKMVIYSRKDQHTQWDNRKPMNRHPGFGHRRFFNWSLKATKKDLKLKKRGYCGGCFSRAT